MKSIVEKFGNPVLPICARIHLAGSLVLSTLAYVGTLYLDSTVGGQSLFGRCIRRIQKSVVGPEGGKAELNVNLRLVKRAEEELRDWYYEYEVQH